MAKLENKTKENPKLEQNKLSDGRISLYLEYFQLSSQIRWRYLDSPNIKDEKSKIEIY